MKVGVEGAVDAGYSVPADGGVVGGEGLSMVITIGLINLGLVTDILFAFDT